MGSSKRAGYRNGGCTLGERDGEAVADFRDEATGKRRRVRLGVAFKDAKASKDALDRFAEARRAITKHQAAHTIADLWTMWLNDRAADGFDNAIYNAHWASLGPAFGHRAPDLLTTQDCRDYARQRFAAGISAWTVHTELRRLSSCLKWAHEHRHIEWRPKVWVPSPGKHRDRVLTFDEARKLVATAAECSDPHVYLFVVLLFATGARHRAILDLTWDRVDFTRGLIQFDEDLPPDPMSRSWRKGRATVPMNDLARKALEIAHAGRQTAHVVEHGGRRLRSARDGFAAAVARAGLSDDVTPHTIRHTVITWLDERGEDRRRAAQLAGHRDERTTARVYTHTSPEALRGTVGALDTPFAPLPKISHVEAGAEQVADADADAKSSPGVPLGQEKAAPHDEGAA